MTSALEPGLYLVATPLGNAADISLRALAVLRAVDAIAAEDTRVTAKLLAIHGIARPLLSYREANARAAGGELLRRLTAGERIALVSDAGTPLIADPGERLVADALAAGLAVTAIPGPSAPIVALVLSGLPTAPFLFHGFLPSRALERRRIIAGLRSVAATLVLLEAPHRLAESLADLADLLGPRPAAVARELTKRFEEVRRQPLDALARHYAGAPPPKGEIVLVVAPPAAGGDAAAPDLDAALGQALASMRLREAVQQVATETGLPRRQVYERALALRGKA